MTLNNITRWIGLLLCCLAIIVPNLAQAEGNKKVRITHFFHDANGTPILAADENGKEIWRRMPYAFGEEVEEHPNIRKYNYRVGYAGHQVDPKTGLIYMQGRYYDPSVGSFTSLDPVGVNPNDVRTFNRYRYGNSNPYKYVDPNGRDAICGSAMGTWQPGLKHGHGRCIPNYKPNERACATGYCGAMNGTGLGVSTKDPLYGLAIISPGILAGLSTLPAWAISSLELGILPFQDFYGRGFKVDPNKFNYFFGKVLTGRKHNILRSAQNLKDLNTLGIRDEVQLMRIFEKAFKNGKKVSTHRSQYGTTITKNIGIGNKGAIDVKFFYKDSDMNLPPSISTIIPKIYK